MLNAGTMPLEQLETIVDSYIRKATVVASLPKGEQVVPVYHEPHHRQLFAHGTTRILEGQFPPGDTSWYHTHTEPILYLTLSTSQQRGQVLGDDWNRGRGGEGGAAPAAPAAGRGAPPAGGRGGAPGVRPTSTISYIESPVTHRIQNVGDRLYRFMAITNASAGDESASDHGFQGRAELTNRCIAPIASSSRRAGRLKATRIRVNPVICVGQRRQGRCGRSDVVGTGGARQLGVVRQGREAHDQQHGHDAARGHRDRHPSVMEFRDFHLREATERDLPLILSFIKALAEYEQLSHAVVATEDTLRESLFRKKAAEAIIAYCGDEPAGFAMFYQTFSTFLGVPGCISKICSSCRRFAVTAWGRCC